MFLPHFDQSATRIILGNLHMHILPVSDWLETQKCVFGAKFGWRAWQTLFIFENKNILKKYFPIFFEGSSALFQTFRGSTFIFKYKNSKWKLSLAPLKVQDWVYTFSFYIWKRKYFLWTFEKVMNCPRKKNQKKIFFYFLFSKTKSVNSHSSAGFRAKNALLSFQSIRCWGYVPVKTF